MTLQALQLLSDLKTVQSHEDGQIWLDVDKKQLTTVIEYPGFGCITLSLSHKWNSVLPILEYLQEKELLRKHSPVYYSLTHSGYHYTQTIVSSAISFLMKSICVPIGISILTTLITLKLFGTT